MQMRNVFFVFQAACRSIGGQPENAYGQMSVSQNIWL